MTETELGLGLIVVLLAAMGIGVPVGIAMLLVGGAGFAYIASLDAVLNFLNTAPFGRVANYTLTVIPMFVLMGEFAARSGIGAAAFKAANAWVGHCRGGLAMATIAACAGFGAICGSSIATGATMARVCLPELKRRGYAGSLATGCLAGGGPLGNLIPPSIVLVLYAIIVEESIPLLFVAALVPGILAAVFYMIAVYLFVRFVEPKAGPPGERVGWSERMRSLSDVWPLALIVGGVIGGIYGGVFTPTEAASLGAAATALVGVARGQLDLRSAVAAAVSAARTSAMIFLILIGAEVYNAFLARTRLPVAVAQWAAELPVHPLLIVGAMLMIYLILGGVMDSFAMILLTVPVFYPVVLSLDLGIPAYEISLWFGILVLVMSEVGLITPPLGLSVFVINSMAPDVPLVQTFRGVMPILCAEAVRIPLLLIFPGIALFLVRL